MNDAAILDGIRELGPRTRDRVIRERLERPVVGSVDAVTLHLDFNARLVSALREERLWPLAAPRDNLAS